MGISISVLDETAPVVRIIEIALSCDGDACTVSDGFQASYISAHASAMKVGWLERQGPQGRLWLCPACSGKRSAA